MNALTGKGCHWKDITSHIGCVQQLYIMDCTKLIMEYFLKMSNQMEIEGHIP